MRRIAMGVRTFLVAVILMVLGTIGSSGQSPRPGETAKRFVGMWRLVSIEGGAAGANANRGPHPTGLLSYDITGHMIVQIMPDRVRPKLAGTEPTPEEAKAVLIGYTAYFGTYSIDEGAQTVTHHQEGNLGPGMPSDLVRRYEFAPGDRLILTPIGNNQNPPSHLIWEQIK